MPGTGFNMAPYAHSFAITTQTSGADKYWSTNTTYEDLLFANGQQVKDYADISHLVKGLAYSKLGVTESTGMTPLMDFITGEGGVEEIDKNFVRWRIYGRPDRRAISFGNSNDAECPGFNRLPFKLTLDVDWYKSLDVLAPNRNKRCQVVIQSEECIPVDGGFEYEVILLGEKEDFFPPEYLEAGQYFIKMGALSSWEKFGSSGSVQFGEGFSYIEFEVPMTTMSWMFQIEGEAHRQYGNLKVTRCDNEGRPIMGADGGGKITNYIEARFRKQIDEEKELFLKYGTKSEGLIDPNSGTAITTGPGLDQWMEEGNIIPYSPESNAIDFIAEQMDALWFDRIPVNQRSIILYTGQAGLKLFSEWVNQKFGETAAKYSYDFVLKKRTPYDTGNKDREGFAFVQPQFTEYVLPTFGSIKVAHWPLLDDTRVNGVCYPGTYYPVSSYEFIAFNVGFGEPNVKMLKRSDNKISTYQAGLWSPFGATGMDNPVFKNPAFMEDCYRMVHRESFGIIMIDASLAVRFTPNIGI